MKIGDKVVSIAGPDHEGASADLSLFHIDGPLPFVGTTWVIRGFVVDPMGVLGLKLISSTVIHIASGIETGWDATRFRKLDELRQEAQQRQGNSPEKEYDES